MFSDRTESQQGRKGNHEETIRTYFSLIKELRAGREEAVEKLLELWDEDGVFEFAGSPPVTGTYHGIHTLYKNRAKSTGMPLKLEGLRERADISKETALGIVNTEVSRMKVSDRKTVASWRTVVGTEDARGFQVSGSHTFTFSEGGKISSLKVVISPRAGEFENLRLEDLSVNDIGRLALAAWAVV
jgi:ketosteroid isomerase-like protein